MALLNGFFTAVAMLGLNRLRGVDPRAVVTHFSGVSTVATLLFLWATGAAGSFTQVTGAGTWALLLGVGAAGMLGQMGMTLAFARGPAARVSVVALAQILFGLAFDVVLWQRQLNAVSLAGMVLVAAPMAWLLLGRRREETLPAAETDRRAHV